MLEGLRAKVKKMMEEHEKKAEADRKIRHERNIELTKYARAEKARIDAEIHLAESRKKLRELGRI
jgi:acetyl-CoA carboxylase carboxyltransferase component